MLSNFTGHLPTGLVFICGVLSFLIPFAFYKVNLALHQYGDPNWKKPQK